MRTIKQGLQNALERKAPVMAKTFQEAIKDGYGDHAFTVYSGSAFDMSHGSNCQQTIRAQAALGYEVVQQYRGPRVGKSLLDGYVVVMVLRPVQVVYEAYC